MTVGGVITFLIVILVCVGFHEFGHFVAAKLCGIRVDEFSIGFGPRLVSRVGGETRYSLRALPLGGFVRMAGMLGMAGEADAGPRNFYRASIPRRLFVMLAGIAFNLVLAFGLFVVGTMMSSPATVMPGGAAQAAGIQDGDSIQTINGIPVDRSSREALSASVTRALAASEGRPIPVAVLTSSGITRNLTIQPRLGLSNFAINNPSCDATKLPQGFSVIDSVNGVPVAPGDPAEIAPAGSRVTGTGVGPDDVNPCPGRPFTATLPTPLGRDISFGWRLGVNLDRPGLPFASASAAAWSEVTRFIPDTVTAIQQISATPDSGGAFGPNGLQGPVGIATQAGQSAAQGLQAVLLFIAVISLNLGYLNLVPIPFLDGGKILIVLLEAVRRKRLAPEREAFVYLVGLAMIIVLVVLVTIGNLRSH